MISKRPKKGTLHSLKVSGSKNSQKLPLISPQLPSNQKSVMYNLHEFNSKYNNSNLVEKDPLNRDIEIAFKKQTIRINPRVKYSLYSPSKNQKKLRNFASLLNEVSHDKSGVLSKRSQEFDKNLGNSNRYASVDLGRLRNVRNKSVNQSISNLYKSSTKGGCWYFKNTSKSAREHPSFNKSILRTKQYGLKSISKENIKTSLKRNPILKVNSKITKTLVPDPHLTYPVKLLKRMEIHYKKKPKMEERGIVYKGERFYELEDLKKLIKFQHLDKLQVDSDPDEE
mmetsp:Transcript_23652/g.21016  ORF Transcript_23652/g.21016 Transcript_23652/m.21016 type:complete len:283 (+) Transcript_23652:186-1034(+)